MSRTILITGANRGLGLEHTRQSLAAGENVIATCRDPSQAEALSTLKQAHPDQLDIFPLEVTDGDAIAGFVDALAGRPVDALINNAGIMGEAWSMEGMGQRIGKMDYDLWEEMLRINLIAPFRMTEALLPNLLAGEGKLVVMMSSDLGSITQNTMGGVDAYRSSKAALNMVMVSLAKELADQSVTVISMAPGWVRTDLGGDAAPYSAEESVAGQRSALAGVTLADSGRFINLKGEAVPW